MAQLRFLDDNGQLQTRSLDSEECVVGRAPNCQIIFVDDTISREHVRIELDSGGRYRVRDLGSRNKTFVNGELITETFLNSGDIIRAGARVLEFLDDRVAHEKIELDFLTPDRTEPPHCEWIKIKAPVSLTTMQVERLAFLFGEQRLLARAEDVAQTALGQILIDLQAERGLLALRGQSKTEITPVVQRGLRRAPGGSLVPVSQSFVFAPLLQGVAGRYPQAASEISTQLGFAATAIAAPLLLHGDPIGVLYLDRPVSKKPFGSADVQYALAAGAQIGAVLSDLSRKLVRNAPREGAAWVTTLRRLQVQLSTTVASGPAFQAAAKHYPGRVRCGDFVDVIHADDLRCCVLVIDGGGHGLTGMAQANAIRAALRTAVAVSPEVLMDPSAVLGSLNQMIAESPSRQSFPVTYAGIDLAAGKVMYVNAGGMPPLLLVGPGRLLTLDQPSLILGVDREYLYEPTRVDVPERFRLICHTDGLIEAVNGAGEAVGAQRIHETLLHHDSFSSVTDVLSRIDSTWTTHLAGAPADDDAAVLVVGRG